MHGKRLTLIREETFKWPPSSIVINVSPERLEIQQCTLVKFMRTPCRLQNGTFAKPYCSFWNPLWLPKIVDMFPVTEMDPSYLIYYRDKIFNGYTRFSGLPSSTSAGNTGCRPMNRKLFLIAFWISFRCDSNGRPRKHGSSRRKHSSIQYSFWDTNRFRFGGCMVVYVNIFNFLFGNVLVDRNFASTVSLGIQIGWRATELSKRVSGDNFTLIPVKCNFFLKVLTLSFLFLP